MTEIVKSCICGRTPVAESYCTIPRSGFTVYCLNCLNLEQNKYNTEQEAIESWNRRFLETANKSILIKNKNPDRWIEELLKMAVMYTDTIFIHDVSLLSGMQPYVLWLITMRRKYLELLGEKDPKQEYLDKIYSDLILKNNNKIKLDEILERKGLK